MVPVFVPLTTMVSPALVELIESPLPEAPTIASRSVNVSLPLLVTVPLAVPELMELSVIDCVLLSAL
jgi:hypothetical protein